MRENKICIVCGKEYHKDQKSTLKQWLGSKYCSLQCSCKKLHELNTGKKRKDLGQQWRDNISKATKGRKLTEEHIRKRTISQTGLKRSDETRRKISEAKSGEKCSFWRGGVSKENRSARKLIEMTIDYKLWRSAVFERDNYTCMNCGERGGKLEAHHIKPFSLFPELVFDMNNGMTLCQSCHRKTDTFGLKAIKKYDK